MQEEKKKQAATDEKVCVMPPVAQEDQEQVPTVAARVQGQPAVPPAVQHQVCKGQGKHVQGKGKGKGKGKPGSL